MKKFFHMTYQFIKGETVLFISGLAALITMFFVTPSTKYLAYLDFRVLALLFSLMAVIAGFNETGIFLLLSNKLLKKIVGFRSLSFVLIMLCFFSSMWITNDVALITFVPFSIMVLTMIQKSDYIIPIVVLQTIAANLGSMLTPVGNPQNLYLYSFYNLSILEFLHITLPYTMVSFALLCISILFIKKEPLNFKLPEQAKPNKRQRYLIALYCVLFLISLACVLHVIDYRISLLIVLIAILLFDRRILRKIDYSLLLTFVCFFLFVGNIGSMPVVKDVLSQLLQERELPVAIAISQVISNVPAAVLLSSFTRDYKALILGTDIGGLGTLVASLASLISYKFYCKTSKARPGKYLSVFTLYNVLFLAAIYLIYRLIEPSF